jgi:DNA-directed RNA polymerase subunit RPC12/RpoP
LIKRKKGRRMFTCPNPSCRKDFTEPLKTLNLQQDSAEPYAACPYCLTRIIEEQVEANVEPWKTQAETVLAEEEPTENIEKPLACHYHLGYLSEREQKEQIPDECIVCKDIVECMLRKMRA